MKRAPQEASRAAAWGSAADALSDLVLDPQQVLTSFPGPAVLLDGLGRAVAANRAGGDLAGLLRAGDPELHAAVAAALADRTAATREVTLPGGGGAREVLDVALLPLVAADGGGCVLLLGRETTVERSFIDALVESRRLFKDLVSVSSDFAWETDGDGRFRYVSPRGALGYTAQELNGRAPYEMLSPEHGEPEIFPFDSRLALEDAEVWLRDKTGASACLIVSCLPVSGEEGYRGTRGVCRDVTEARALDAALARAERSSRLLARVMEAIRSEVAPAAMLAAAAEATAGALGARHCWILRAGGAAFAVAARSATPAPDGAEAALSAAAARCLPGAASVAAIAGLSTALAAAAYQGRCNGAVAVARDAGAPGFDGEERGLLVQVADRLAIALEQVANTELLERLSRTDELTGLLNRRAFFDQIAVRLRHQQRTGRAGALLYVDLDNFKPVNDRHGHRRGDEAICAVAALLGGGTRVGDIAARLGGDEFALWLEESGEAAAAAKARTLVHDAAAVLAPFSAGDDAPLGVSVGVAVSSAGELPDSLLARADEAMYAAKRAGKGSVAVASPAPGG